MIKKIPLGDQFAVEDIQVRLVLLLHIHPLGDQFASIFSYYCTNFRQK